MTCPTRPHRGEDRLRAKALAVVASDPLGSARAQYNLEVEQALLGAILVENSALDRVVDFLTLDHFFDPLHARIFETLTTLISAGRSASPFTVKPYFDGEIVNPTTTVAQYLGKLSSNATTTRNAAEYGRTIVDFAKSRQLSALCSELTKRLQEQTISVAEITAEALPRFEALAESSAVKPVGTYSAATLQGKVAPAREWHVPDWIPHRTVTNISADGGTGKSLLALQLAVATATGGQWLGMDVKRGKVLVVTVEDDDAELHRRLQDITRDSDRGIDFKDLPDLHIHNLAGQDAIFANFDHRNVMFKTLVWSNVLRHIKRLKPRLLIIDPLADVFGGDEINRAQARAFVQMFAGAAFAHDMTVVLTSHPSVAGMTSGSGSSGSTAWSNSVRSRLYFERVKSGDGTELDPDARTITTKKANYGRTGATIGMHWRHGVFRHDADDSVSEAAYAARVRAEAAFMALMKTFNEQKRNVSANTGTSYAPALFEQEELGRQIGRPGLLMAMSSLLDQGRIRVEEFGPPTRRRTRLTVVG